MNESGVSMVTVGVESVTDASESGKSNEDIVHALRTPLSALLGFAQLLHEGKVDPASPQHREFLGDILECGQELDRLITVWLERGGTRR